MELIHGATDTYIIKIIQSSILKIRATASSPSSSLYCNVLYWIVLYFIKQKINFFVQLSVHILKLKDVPTNHYTIFLLFYASEDTIKSMDEFKLRLNKNLFEFSWNSKNLVWIDDHVVKEIDTKNWKRGERVVTNKKKIIEKDEFVYDFWMTH